MLRCAKRLLTGLRLQLPAFPRYSELQPLGVDLWAAEKDKQASLGVAAAARVFGPALVSHGDEPGARLSAKPVHILAHDFALKDDSGPDELAGPSCGLSESDL